MIHFVHDNYISLEFCVSKNMCFLSDDWIIQSWPEGLCQLNFFTCSLPQGNYVCIWCDSWPGGLVLLITQSSRWKAVFIFSRPMTTHLQRPNFKSEGMCMPRLEPASWHGPQPQQTKVSFCAAVHCGLENAVCVGCSHVIHFLLHFGLVYTLT